MKHNQEFWKRHVKGWRESGLSRHAYCSRHHLPKGTLSYWASKLKKVQKTESALIEVGRTEVKEQTARSPIELVIKGRYLLRLWPGMEPGHMRDVLSVLEHEL